MKPHEKVISNLDMLIHKRKAPIYVSSIRMVPLVFKAVRHADIKGVISLAVLKAIWVEYALFIQGKLPRRILELNVKDLLAYYT